MKSAKKKQNDNPITLLDVIIIIGPLAMLVIISLVAYLLK